MATAEEGGATAATTTTTTYTSSYGGEGGAGGKFRRKPFRRPTKPYDRPAVSLNGNCNNENWYSKVVNPFSRLISYGARRFFDYVIQKRLPPPPPPQISDSNHVLNDVLSEAVPIERAGGECSQPIRNSGRTVISDLEQLLKEKTFNRSEINYLTDLLHSREEVSLRDDRKRNEDTVSEFGSRQQIESEPTEANSGVVSTSIFNSKVLGNNIASPAELAKTYMGSRPLKLSPSELNDHSHVAKGNTKLLSNTRIASKPASLSLTTNTVVDSGSPENGYITKPSSFRRSAIYNMSRSPYSKTLKRRSFVLDDQVESVGQIRRIRQKSNLLPPGVPHADRVGSNSDASLVSSKQKLPLIVDQNLMDVGRTEKSSDISIPSTSYAIVPYEYDNTDVAVGRTRNLEKTALKDKFESKVVAEQQKLPFKMASTRLRGQALKIMENTTYSEFPVNFQDDDKFESSTGLSGAHDFPPQKQGKVEENGPVETAASSDIYSPVIKNDSAVSFGVSVESGLSQPKNRAAFRMSALEDYVDLDDDLPCNGVASRPFPEGREPVEAQFTDSKSSPPEESKVLESAIHSELKSPTHLMSSKTNEISGSVSVAASLREGSNGVITIASEEVTSAVLSTVPLLVASFGKPKEINNPPSLFNFGSKVADKFPSLIPESSCRTPESSSSLLDVSTPTSSLVQVVHPEQGGYLKPPTSEDTSRNFDTVSVAASNGLHSDAPAVSFTATSRNNNTHQISTAAPVIFTTSVSASDHIASGTGSINSATSSGIIFGAIEAPKASGEPAFKFGVSPDISSKVSAVSTPIIPVGDMKNKASTDSSSGIPNSSSTKFVAFGAPSSGNVTSGLGSLTNILSTNNPQGSLFSSDTKYFLPAVGTVSQVTSAPSFSLSSQPSSNPNSSTSFVTSLSSSQVPSPTISFGLNASASSSDTGAVVSSSGPTSSLFGGSAVGSSGFTTPSMFSSSSSSTNAIGSTTGATAASFSFGASSSGSAPVTTSFFSDFSSTGAVGSTGGAATIFGFGSSSQAPTSQSNGASSLSNSASGVFKFGGSSSNNASSSAFGSSLQTPTSPVFGASPATGFSFGASATAPSSNSPFLFGSASASVFSSPSPTPTQPVFGNAAPIFAASSPGNNHQMIGDDSMAEDPVQPTAPSASVFGLMSGSSTPSQPNSFQFGGQQNPSMFQASGSVEFNAGAGAGGGFSLGSGGEKAGRRYVKPNRNKNRKK